MRVSGREDMADKKKAPARNTMEVMREKGPRVSREEMERMLDQHRLFLESGGAGGAWQTLITVSGLVFGVYLGASGAMGKQAKLTHRNLENLDLRGLMLPSADLTGILCRQGDLSGSDLSGSLLIDSDFSGSRFTGANLSHTDFSRSRMMNCSFVNANLNMTDFENADLSGSDFTGALVVSTSFKGARMENVKMG